MNTVALSLVHANSKMSNPLGTYTVYLHTCYDRFKIKPQKSLQFFISLIKMMFCLTVPQS